MDHMNVDKGLSEKSLRTSEEVVRLLELVLGHANNNVAPRYTLVTTSIYCETSTELLL